MGDNITDRIHGIGALDLSNSSDGTATCDDNRRRKRIYLNANMNCDVVLKIDPVMTDLLAKSDPDYSRLKDIDGSTIVKLEKALYGCVESSQL